MRDGRYGREVNSVVVSTSDITSHFLPRDGRTGLKLITESRVKRRSTSAGPLAIMCKVMVF